MTNYPRGLPNDHNSDNRLIYAHFVYKNSNDEPVAQILPCILYISMHVKQYIH